MARPLRVKYPGAIYHVTARGNDRREIFANDADQEHFVELLKTGMEEFDVELYAWVFMPNHYHLVIQTHQPNLNRFMHYLNTAYTVWVNRKHQHTGHLFEGRYKAIVLQEESYLLSVTVYVCLNPVRIKAVRGLPLKEKLTILRRYAWGSYADYALGKRGESWPRVNCATVWGELGGRNQREGRRQFRRHVAGWLEEDRQRSGKDAEEKKWEKNPLSQVERQTYLGGEEFGDYIQELLDKNEELSDSIAGAWEWKSYPELNEVLEAGCRVLGLNRSRLARRTRGDERKAMLLYLAQRKTRCDLRELAKVFDVTPSAISQRLRAFRNALDSDSKLCRRVKQHEVSLSAYLKL
jgi:REP element-mobilizing transposase RayT